MSTRGGIAAGFAALAAVFVVTVSVSVSTAWATFPGANGRIAYSADDDGIRTVLPSGNGATTISVTGWDAGWSPNGRRLLFADSVGQEGGWDILTMRADGSDLRRLTTYGDLYNGWALGASYSPGGGRIVFLVHGYHEPTTITTMRSDGSDRRYLNTTGDDYHYPVWSPTGRIAYVEPGNRLSIWVMRSDGSHNHRLVRLGKSGGYGPIYSPDGSEFLFVRYRGDGTVVTKLASADGSDVRPAPCPVLSTASVTFGGSVFPAGVGVFPVAYSPNGRRLLVQRENGSYPSALLRLSLRSCKAEKVASHVLPHLHDADWQSLSGG